MLIKEKHIQIELGKYIKANLVKFPSGVFELKLCKESRFPYSKVATHQIHALIEAKHTGIYHKISDPSSGNFANTKTRFTAKNPFDFFISKGNAYVAVCFYTPRKKKIIYFVDIDTFEQSRLNSVYKSLTEKECEQLADYIIDLKENNEPSAMSTRPFQ